MLGCRQQKELEKQQLQLAIQKHKLEQRRLTAQLAAQGRLLAQQQAQLDAMQRGGGEVSDAVPKGTRARDEFACKHWDGDALRPGGGEASQVRL